MNTSYISFTKPIEIHDMHDSLVEKHREEPAQLQLLLSEKLLNELFQEHYYFLCRIAMNIVKDNEAAKDIVQNFFLYCWEKKSKLKIQGSFKNYAYRSICHASIKYQKRMVIIDYDSEYISKAAEKTVYTHDTDRYIFENERDQKLWDMIDQMPDKRKEIFLLSQRKGFTYNQIADNLNISVNTVKTQIKRAFVFLRTEGRWMISILSWLLLIK